MRRYHSSLAIIAALALGCDDGERRAEPTAAESQQQGGTAGFGEPTREQYPGGDGATEAPAANEPDEAATEGVGGGLLGTGVGSGSGGAAAPDPPPLRDEAGRPIVRTEPDAGGQSGTGAIVREPVTDAARPVSLLVGRVSQVSDGLVVVEDAAGGFHRLTLGPDTRFAGEQGRRPAPGDAVRIEYLVQGEQRLARRLEVLQPPAGH